MSEKKRCWQIDYLSHPTPCYVKAGSVSCETAGCLVDVRSDELSEGTVIDQDLIELLCHSRCRISSLSQDNEEYLARLLQTVA